MSDKHTELFRSSDLADVYVKYRPTYGPDVSEAIISFCRENTSAPFSLAIDVGCGSGQSTLPLTKHFHKVIGLDVSEAQIARAPTHVPNLSFRVGPAEDLSFVDSGSVDLVTAGTTLHWIDLEKFYPEVQRVLRPGGALVAYCYWLPCPDEPSAQELVVWYYKDLLGPYWSEGIKHLEQRYRTLSLPFEGWRRNDDLKTEECWTVDELVGFLCSWSAYHEYMLHNPTSCARENIKERLQAVYHDGKGGERKVTVTWPIFMLMGRKPQE